MLISRRALLTGSIALSCGDWLASAQDAAPLIIEAPDVPLHTAIPTVVAVNTSGVTRCDVAFLDAGGAVRSRSRTWATEPDVSNGQQLPAPGGGWWAPVAHRVRVRMEPVRPAMPSLAVALVQRGSPSADGRGSVPAATPADEAAAVDRAKRLARQARFLDDPASPPGGQLIARLDVDSSVRLRIWKGETGRDAPLIDREFSNLPEGDNPIRWDLTGPGGPVSTGRYLATLVCTPRNSRLLPTIYVAYFGVRMPSGA